MYIILCDIKWSSSQVNVIVSNNSPAGEWGIIILWYETCVESSSLDQNPAHIRIDLHRFHIKIYEKSKFAN